MTAPKSLPVAKSGQEFGGRQPKWDTKAYGASSSMTTLDEERLELLDAISQVTGLDDAPLETIAAAYALLEHLTGHKVAR